MSAFSTINNNRSFSPINPYRDSAPRVGGSASGGGVEGPNSRGDGFQGSRDAQLEGDLEKRLQAATKAQGQDRESAVAELKKAYDGAGGRNANISEDLKNKIEQVVGGGQGQGAGQQGGCGGPQGGGGAGQPQGGGQKGGGGGQPQGCGQKGGCGNQEPYKASKGVQDALDKLGIKQEDVDKIKADQKKADALKELGITQEQVDSLKKPASSESPQISEPSKSEDKPETAERPDAMLEKPVTPMDSLTESDRYCSTGASTPSTGSPSVAPPTAITTPEAPMTVATADPITPSVDTSVAEPAMAA